VIRWTAILEDRLGNSHVALLVELLVLGGACFTGCADVKSANLPAPQSQPVSNSTIVHDFGVIRPKSRAEHQFLIKNDSAIPWTVASILATCRCTLATTPTEVIPPSGQGVFNLSYEAPTRRTDESKSVEVQFKESEAPRFTLTIKAAVRETVDVYPSVLRFQLQKRPNAEVTSYLEVANYGLAQWEGIQILSCPEWLEITEQSTPVRRSEAGQVFRLPVSVSAANLAAKEYRATLKIKVGQDTAEIPVFVSVASPVYVAPSRLFYGRLQAGEAKTKKLMFRFSDVLPTTDSIRVHHEFGDQLDYRWEEIAADSILVLAVTITPKATTSAVKSGMAFDIPEFGMISVPIDVWLQDTHAE
jgi:hypothetical protein